jgi:hypothetical protein
MRLNPVLGRRWTKGNSYPSLPGRSFRPGTGVDGDARLRQGLRRCGADRDRTEDLLNAIRTLQVDLERAGLTKLTRELRLIKVIG